MYLTRREIEATLAAAARRSTAGARLIVAYHSPALIRRLIGAWVRRLGEPLRSAFMPAAMRDLLASYGFEIVRDEGVPETGARLSADVARATRGLKHARVAVADRRSKP